MNWRRNVNAVLTRTTGLELRRARRLGPAQKKRRARDVPRNTDRLLHAPAFILSTVRSGSTLMRVLLDSHSQIHSPPELHLRHLSAGVNSKYAEKALAEIGLDQVRLEYLLWDRVLHRELQEAGKSLLVNKTPSDVYIADRIVECWPDARFIFLLRHPAAIAASRHKTRPQDTPERNETMVLRYGDALEQARQAHSDRGITVRYEDVAADPRTETQRICEFLGVEWEPAMLEYGEFDHGVFRPGLGDWKEKIKSGRVQPPAPLPAAEDVPEGLRALAAAWGYLPAAVTQPSSS